MPSPPDQEALQRWFSDLLGPLDSQWIARLVFWSDARACYGWQLCASGIVLASPDPEERLNDSSAGRLTLEVQLAAAECNALSAAADALHAIAPLQRIDVDHRPSPGKGLLLLEFFGGSSHLLDAYALEQFFPEERRGALLDFFFDVERRFFPELGAQLHALSSPLAALSIDELAGLLADQTDGAVAFLYRHLPARNLRRYLDGLPESQARVVLERAASLARPDPDSPVLRAMERALLNRRSRGARVEGGRR
ncbi:MAG: hypothetical protein K1X75_13425 [Leptospirales bacterium]|nr:hypothetical protein [Leptospirales bacterium]